jgi:hypothetical protein
MAAPFAFAARLAPGGAGAFPKRNARNAGTVRSPAHMGAHAVYQPPVRAASAPAAIR